MIAAIGWLFLNHEYVRTRIYYVDEPRALDKVFGIILILLTLEAARRSIGWVMPATAGVFLVYACAGPYLPGLLEHPGMSLGLVVDDRARRRDGENRLYWERCSWYLANVRAAASRAGGSPQHFRETRSISTEAALRQLIASLRSQWPDRRRPAQASR